MNAVDTAVFGELTHHQPVFTTADVRGYVSLLSAPKLHGMIDQAPHVIQIVAERIRPTVRTPFGTYQFHRLDPALIGGYGPYRNTGNFDIATPAKAL
jgi:hypothetical protein